ncbi:MAG: LON peptidase substrate-binding domain-containing protein [Methylotenera sp.]|uniref:LON peptidase substrate-binding domain-containing protein n=1 Tax=Methylotenera sp. TaxID=2051956 RepID=UPI00273167BB|nr:LON peptidase substrate-binding domain-containing protein [Methylotenera sp.]MDP1524013.1 LON peptidase substrate-binding domain-containing protein [Methylotenera sp.]
MRPYTLPLFPLNVVVCPGGLLPLRIFEARYLDMVRTCLRNKSSFAVVAVMPEGETDPEGYFPFANIGTLVDIVEADVTTVGLMNIRCVGRHRVKVDSYLQQPDGLVVGQLTDVANDLESAIPEDLESVVTSLQNLLTSLPASGVSPENMPVIKPYHFENAAWVANRWVELLDLPLLQKQRLMQLDSPVLRLELIHDILYENPRNKI